MKRMCFFSTLLFLGFITVAKAQVGIGTPSPNASARLQVDASATTNAKGFLPPRVTATERGAITAPAPGLMVYQTDGTAGLYYFDGSSWIYIINATTSTLPVANGGTGAINASAARTNLGATTVGSNLFTLPDQTDIRFPRINANNTVSTLTDAEFRTAIGAGTSSTTGTVTSVATGSGLTGGTITGTGTISLANGTAAGQVFVTGASPFTPALRSISGDATLSSTGVLTITNGAVALGTDVTGTLPVANGGTGTTSSTGSGNVVFSNSPSLSNIRIQTTTGDNSIDISGNSSNASTINFFANNGTTRHGFIYGDGNGMQVGSASSLPLRFMIGGGTGVTPVEHMRLTNDGRLGIGTSSPEVPLHINGSVDRTYLDYRHYGRWVTADGNLQGSYSIYASNLIRSTGFNAISDVRIKRDIVRQNSANQLSILNQLNVVNYSYIDKLVNGSKTKTGFIAQQVESVNPEFVNRSADFIPSVFAMAKTANVENGTLTVSTEKPHGFEKGDEVKLFAEGKKETIMSIEDVKGPNAFSVKGWASPTKDLFVYGKKVSDFRAIDFDQVTALSVAAIQELNKQIDALKAENTELKKNLTDELQSLKNQINLLKEAMRKEKKN